MAALINTPLAPQAYEVVCAKVAEIIALELPNQIALLPSEDLTISKIFYQREKPIQRSEGSVVNVLLPVNTYDRKTQKNTHSTATIYIDVYGTASQPGQNASDERSRIKTMRLLGLCKAILEAAPYKTLGFAPNSFIKGTATESIAMDNPENRRDQDAVTMGRLTFNVRAIDSLSLDESLPLVALERTSQLYDTNEDYLVLYEFDDGQP